MDSKKHIENIRAKKSNHKKITVLTAYTYPMAKLVDEAGVDIILVGDSLANVVLGLGSTKDVGMEEMLHHTRAVRRGVSRALLVGDMPYEAYQVHPEQAVIHARRFIDEAGCDAVKVEWFEECPQVVEALVAAGIPVMGHIGLTPQTVDKLGGFKTQGRDLESAQKIYDQAMLLQEKGCFSLVLECVAFEVAEIISEDLSIPTIGIGAGRGCDGQVLVTHDLLGLFGQYKPKFVKQYAQLNTVISESLARYCQEVEDGTYPGPEHAVSFSRQRTPSAPLTVPTLKPGIVKPFLRSIARGMLIVSRWLIQRMPYPLFRAFTRLFIGLGYCLMLKKKKLALKNLRQVFGTQKSEAEVQRIAQECFDGFGRGMVEVIYYADRPHLIPDIVEIEGKEILDDVLKQGRGAILVSAHFGNFLMMYFRMIRAGYPTNVIMRRTRDAKFEKYISDFRRSFGLKTIYDLPSRKCIHDSLRVLRNNELLFILLDQNYGTDGRVFVDFLGQPAATATGPVIFSCRTQAPVLPVFIERIGTDQHRIKIEPPLKLDLCANDPNTLGENVARITRVIEQRIRQQPHLWGGWMHKRWKSKPQRPQTLHERINEKIRER